jgi:hypothetical protein
MSGGNNSSEIESAKVLNSKMIDGPESKPPKLAGSFKRLALLFGGIIILSLISSLIYFMFLKPEPPVPTPEPEPKPVTTSIEIKGDNEIAKLNYGLDYFVDVSGENYLVSIVKSPKRVIYNGEEVYRGEDLVASFLSANGKYWAIQTTRDEQRIKRDENTKIEQSTVVQVATFTVNNQEWGQKDNSRLLGVSDSGAPQYVHKTGKQTPSQYGEALEEEVVFAGESERFKTDYGVVSYRFSGDASDWLITTKNPSTKEVYDFFVNGAKKDSLDARILKRASIDNAGNYLLAFCKEGSEFTGVGLIGRDCQISVNGNTRTTISGTVYLASNLGLNETYAGIDRELRQGFSKNSRVDLILEHRKDMDEDPNTILGVYLNETGTKYAVVTSRQIKEIASRTDTPQPNQERTRVNLSINAEVIDNSIMKPSLFAFGTGEDAETLFIYELPLGNEGTSPDEQ